MESESRRVAWIEHPFGKRFPANYAAANPPNAMRQRGAPGSLVPFDYQVDFSISNGTMLYRRPFRFWYHILTEVEAAMVESLYPVANRQLPVIDSQFPVDAELFPPWDRIRSDLIVHCGQRVTEVDQLDAMTILSLLEKWHRESQGPVECQPAVAIGNPASEQPERPRPDGPEAPNILRWKGREKHEIQSQPFKVLEFMWNKEKPVRWESLVDHLWGINSSQIESSLKTPIFRANKILSELGVPWQIGQKNGFVVKS